MYTAMGSLTISAFLLPHRGESTLRQSNDFMSKCPVSYSILAAPTFLDLPFRHSLWHAGNVLYHKAKPSSLSSSDFSSHYFEIGFQKVGISWF